MRQILWFFSHHVAPLAHRYGAKWCMNLISKHHHMSTSMKYGQDFYKNLKKYGGARCHHFVFILIGKFNELKISFFTQHIVLKNVFRYALWCDVCAPSLYLCRHNLLLKIFRLVNTSRNKSFLFLQFLPNFLGKTFLII